ncbi:hypothetical protein EBR96_10300, partial [bacterium]|nr:hypothetical protein [bacterium]
LSLKINTYFNILKLKKEQDEKLKKRLDKEREEAEVELDKRIEKLVEDYIIKSTNFIDYKKEINTIIYPYINTINEHKDINDKKLLDFINKIPKVELHIHLEGIINNTLIKQFENPNNKNISELDNPFDNFNRNVEILCSSFKHNIKILLEYVYEDRYKQNIYYTQFHLSSLKIHNLTSLTVQKQFDIIIDIISIIKQNIKYNHIIIQFILDIPRGNAFTYNYLENYFDEIIILSKIDKYKQYIIAVGIGGRVENYTIDNTYLKYYQKFQNTTLKIIPHAGEFGTTDVTCKSIQSALNYSQRIGHGVRIIECDKTQIKNKSNIVLDINISSNLKFIDQYNNDINLHPLKQILEEYNITLSTDDPGILYSENKEYINLLHEYKLLFKIIKNYSLKQKINLL